MLVECDCGKRSEVGPRTGSVEETDGVWGLELDDVLVEQESNAMAMSAIKPKRKSPGDSANTRPKSHRNDLEASEGFARISDGTFVSGLGTTAVAGRRGFVALASSKAVARKAQLCASQ